VVDLADVSWHPLLASTNVPYGLVLKRTDLSGRDALSPIPIRIFVEHVRPGELLSVRSAGNSRREEEVTASKVNGLWL